MKTARPTRRRAKRIKLRRSPQMRPISPSLFGRDHWSTLAYIECICVDNGGVPGRQQMRCNPARHPGLAHSGGWSNRYSTRLRGHTEETPKMRRGHDDWDCADDLAAAGYIIIEGTGLNPIWRMTTVGSSVCAALRAHKATGGSFSTFTS